MNWCWDESFEFHLGIYFSHLLKYLYVFVQCKCLGGNKDRYIYDFILSEMKYFIGYNFKTM